MELEKWLNSVPDIINFHDMSLIGFEIESDYIFLRWGLSKWGCSIYDELKSVHEKMNENDILLIDQVFFKPKHIDITMPLGLCIVDMEVVYNDYKNDTMKIFARDGVENYLSLNFKFENFKTKLFKIIDYSENLEEYTDSTSITII